MPGPQVFIPVGYAQVIHKLRLVEKTRLVTITYGVHEPDLDNVPSLMAPAIHGMLSSGAANPLSQVKMFVGNALISTVVINGLTPDPDQFEHAATVEGSSAGVADQATQSMTYVISKKTAIRGRKHQGRMYVPLMGVPDTSITTRGFLNGAQVTAITANWELFRTNLAAATMPMVILHTDPTVTPTPVVQLICRPQVGTQRRRLRA